MKEKASRQDLPFNEEQEKKEELPVQRSIFDISLKRLLSIPTPKKEDK